MSQDKSYKFNQKGKCFITGGAGFVGSTMTDRLLADGVDVVAFDNLSTGNDYFLQSAKSHENFSLIRGDLLDTEALSKAMKGCDFVFHFAANADVRFGFEHPKKDLEQNTIGTFNVLEAMRANGIKQIAFTSTSSIYGDTPVVPTSEDTAFPVQTSLYGASKLAGEGLIQAYSAGYGFKSFIFRPVGIVGERYTHGHIFDICKKLEHDGAELNLLGDGSQRKSLIYIQDLLNGMFCAIENGKDAVNIYNLGTDEYCAIKDSASWIVSALKANPKVNWAGGDRGWVGDNPFTFLDSSKLRAHGWQPQVTIKDGIIKTVEYLMNNRSLLAAQSTK